MAIAVSGYPLGWMHCWTNGIDLDAASWKLALATSTYTPAIDTHDFFNDLTNEVAAGSGYTAGGIALSGIAFSYDAASDQVRLTWTNPVFPFVGAVTWRYGVAYIDTAGASSADPLMLLLDWGASQTSSVDYTVAASATGLLGFDFTP